MNNFCYKSIMTTSESLYGAHCPQTFHARRTLVTDMHIENRVGKLFLVQSIVEPFQLIAVWKLYVYAPSAVVSPFGQRILLKRIVYATPTVVLMRWPPVRPKADMKVLLRRRGNDFLYKGMSITETKLYKGNTFSVCKQKMFYRILPVM